MKRGFGRAIYEVNCKEEATYSTEETEVFDLKLTILFYQYLLAC